MSLTAVPSSDRCSFRASARESGSPRPDGEPQPNVAIPQATLEAVPSAFWITVYGLGLLFLIVVYYASLAAVILGLLDLERILFDNLHPIEGLWFLKINLVFVLLFPITRLATHLWRGIVGLVTQRYDTLPDQAIGVLLSRAEHPEIYAAVADVGQRVKSPVPDEIRLTFRPVCYAVELRSFAIRTDRKLVLVIGLPHLEVLTLTELKVIVAHELAHFGGGDTRLIVFIFRFLQSLRVAQQENAKQSWRWIDPVAWLSWAYYHGFLMLSAPIHRHQEFRADGFSAAAFGGEFSAQTLLKDYVLEHQFDETLQRFLHTIPRKSSDAAGNVFRQFAAKFHDYSPQGQSYLEERLRLEEQPSFWDLHPTVPERMRYMRRYVDRELPEPLPAYLLLRDGEMLEKRLQEQLDAQQSAFPRNYVE